MNILKMNQDTLFNEVYQRNPSNNHYRIEIALNQYSDVFSEWDPAPYKRRELDPDLELYLKGCSDEIPLRHLVELWLLIPAEIRDEAVEEEVRIAFKNSLAFKMYFLKRELRKTNIKALRCILLGFLFLWLGSAFSVQYGNEGLRPLLAEALIIGGWVFLWEAVSLFFFTDHEIYHRYRAYKRWQKAPIIFQEAAKN
jgi:hypothetical protein